MEYGAPASGPGAYVPLRDPASSHRRSRGAAGDFDDGEVRTPFIAAYENQAFAPSAPPAPPGGLSDGLESQPAPADDSKEKSKSPSKHPRLQSLDMFRGLTIGWMIMADDSGNYSNHLLDHSPWDHVTFADFVFPFFVFITGCSVALSFTKYKSRVQAVSHSFERFAKLFIIGLIVQGGNFPTQYPLYTLRIPGILQRIGWCYLCACLVEILVPPANFDFDDTEPSVSRRNLLSMYVRYWTHWLVFLIATVVYILLMFTTQVPGCDGLGHLDEQCNAAGYWDQKILGLNHMYNEPTFNRAPECSLCSPGYCPYPTMPDWCSMSFDPEGIVSSISAVGSALIGLHFGHVIMRCKSHEARMAQWLPLAAICLCLGFAVQGMGFPFNKNLWSTSYVFFMAGIAGFGLSFFYLTVDVVGTREGPLSKIFVWIFQPLRWLGMNAIFVFVMAASDVFDTLVSYIYWQTPDQNLINMLQTTWLPNAFGDDGAILAYALGKIGFWMLVSGALHYKGIYFKV